MIFVVALSSSLDVAAIELELNEPLNYNSELTMVGLSNLMSGLTGGYGELHIQSDHLFVAGWDHLSNSWLCFGRLRVDHLDIADTNTLLSTKLFLWIFTNHDKR
ncbi:secondary active sulfate transmembrane transporter [Fragilaria crotonensis]|nr:secondary active sulfate transmembrane transporter [Fragilaria crotonensis]